MDDDQIISLYWDRDESALRETDSKYGPYLTRIALNILADPEDSRESVNDTYLRAWRSMPPHRPARLAPFLAKIVRELSIDRLRTRERGKRKASEYDLSLDELAECVSGGDVTAEQADLHLLAEAIGSYLRTLPAPARNAFVGRYFYADPLKEVARYCGMGEARAKSLLYRTRQGLKAYLTKEGFLP